MMLTETNSKNHLPKEQNKQQPYTNAETMDKLQISTATKTEPDRSSVSTATTVSTDPLSASERSIASLNMEDTENDVEDAVVHHDADKSRRVQFGCVHVHTHPIVMGLPPAMPMIGAPIQLGWTKQESMSVTIDEYETDHRHNHATEFKALRIASSVRENWLKNAGYSRMQIEYVRNLASDESADKSFEKLGAALLNQIYTKKGKKSKKSSKTKSRSGKASRSLSPPRRLVNWVGKRMAGSKQPQLPTMAPLDDSASL